MTRDQFLNRCKGLWHVAPAGAWDRVVARGFRTAEQLILAADLGDDDRAALLTEPRREDVELTVDGERVVLHDQGSLFARKDPPSGAGNGLAMSDWVEALNRRVYFFTDEAKMRTLLNKYVARDGAQDLIALSPMRLLDAADGRIELSAQNIGTVARRTGPQKTGDAFCSVTRFPDRKPAEVTVVDGFDDASVIVRGARHFADGSEIALR